MGLISVGLPSVRRIGNAPPARMPAEGPMADSFGWVATSLRVSLTDRCNLRCTYCMPAQGMEWPARDELLCTDEMVRVLSIAVTRLGNTSVRFTGGEPLLSKNRDEVLAATAQLRPRPEIALTTNGAWPGAPKHWRSPDWRLPGGTGCPTCCQAWPLHRRLDWDR